jgi:hypothetical protein
MTIWQHVIERTGAARDDCQEVVEVMSNARGQLAEQAHALSMQKIGFLTAALGQVSDQRQDDGVLVVRKGCEAYRDRDAMAVSVEAHDL